MTLSKIDVIETAACPLCETAISTKCTMTLENGLTTPYYGRSHAARIRAAEKIHATEQKGLASEPPPL